MDERLSAFGELELTIPPPSLPPFLLVVAASATSTSSQKQCVQIILPASAYNLLAHRCPLFLLQYSNSFYLSYLAKWPDLCATQTTPTGRLMGYGQPESRLSRSSLHSEPDHTPLSFLLCFSDWQV